MHCSVFLANWDRRCQLAILKAWWMWFVDREMKLVEMKKIYWKKGFQCRSLPGGPSWSGANFHVLLRKSESTTSTFPLFLWNLDMALNLVLAGKQTAEEDGVTEHAQDKQWYEARQVGWGEARPHRVLTVETLELWNGARSSFASWSNKGEVSGWLKAVSRNLDTLHVWVRFLSTFLGSNSGSSLMEESLLSCWMQQWVMQL